MTNFTALAKAGIQALHPYVGGKDIDELARELGLDPSDIVKLASNENPLGSSKTVTTAVAKAAADLTRYPDGNGYHLKQALGKKLGVDPRLITLGNGSSDLLHFIIEVLCQAGDEVVFFDHAFALYEMIAQACELQAVIVPTRDFQMDLTDLAAAVSERTKVVFLTNPNNPTGTWVNEGALTAFMESIPVTTMVVLDEAYFEFVTEADYPDTIAMMQRFDNLMVTRTFSKAYGLAGMRVGYGIANEQITDLMNRIRPPFNVNQLALVAAEAALKDEDFLHRSVAENKAGLQFFEQAFRDMQLAFIPSVANFISVDVETDAKQVYEKMLRLGVIVRPLSGYGMPQHLRISIGTEEENVRCLQAFKHALGK